MSYYGCSDEVFKTLSALHWRSRRYCKQVEHKETLRAFLLPWDPKKFEYQEIDLGYKNFKFDSEWLPQNESSKFPSYHWIKLSGIRYKSFSDVAQLCGIQLVFTVPGLESQFHETYLPIADKEATTLKEAKIDTSKTIRSVSVKIFNGFAINGLRFTDEEGENLLDLDLAKQG